MKKVNPASGFSDKGYQGALEITSEEAASIIAGKIEEIIKAGKNADAIKDGWILLQNQYTGQQIAYRLEGFCVAFAKSPLF